MATFSSFVDLENQSVIIQQPDPTTLYSVVRHQPISEPPPSASPATVEQMRRMSPNLRYMDDATSPSRCQRSHTPTTPSRMVMIEKRDGSFQTLLTIAPSEDIDSNKARAYPDSSPSPLSTGSSSTTDPHHQHHHRHRRHKSRSNTSRSNISTRDVGLQVNIQTVKKITFSSQKSDDSSSVTTSTSSPPTIKTTRELKHVQTNTESSTPSRQDRSTSYEKSLNMITSSAQTLDSPINGHRQTKAAQTPPKSLRDQSTETNNQGLFVCDLSSFLKNGTEDVPSTLTPKRKV
ncbi:unnamed protein product [Adineta ricciae]|nr:unnamed protein product [Adineta ricciae]